MDKSIKPKEEKEVKVIPIDRKEESKDKKDWTKEVLKNTKSF